MRKLAMLAACTVSMFGAGKFERISTASHGRVAGAAMFGTHTLYTWGDALRSWSIPGLRSRVIARGQFGEGGCLTDLDHDGKPEFVTVEGEGLGDLRWSREPDGKPEIVDRQVAIHDCTEANLFGHHGLLTIHRAMQVRFYQRPSSPSAAWLVREIYSIYTPSDQGGLAIRDVDHDGHADLYCGNYWIRSPESFDLPWRLFAINTYSEQRLSAMLRIVPSGEDLVVSQSHLDPARLTYFEKPQNPQLQWIDHRLSSTLKKPHGLAIADLDGDGRADVVVGEQNGATSRLLVFWNRGQYRFEEQTIAQGDEVVQVWGLSNGGFLVAGTEKVSLWRYRRR